MVYTIVMSILIGAIGGVQLYNQLKRKSEPFWSSYWLLYAMVWLFWIGDLLNPIS